MKMQDILEQQAAYTKNSNYKVTVNALFSWISMECQDADCLDHESVFLQGSSADNFITEAETLWNETPTVDYDTVIHALAMPYIDAM